jgi:hypothetical protein
MVRKTIVALFILAVCLVTVSCKKLHEPIKPTGLLIIEAPKFRDAIPKEYGPLISVTSNSQLPSWYALWFQRSDGTITVVFVEVDEGKLDEKVVTIPRK